MVARTDGVFPADVEQGLLHAEEHATVFFGGGIVVVVVVDVGANAPGLWEETKRAFSVNEIVREKLPNNRLVAPTIT